MTATVWPGSQEPLLLLDVSRSVLPRLRPGFARDLTADVLVIPHHPHAHLSIHDGAGSLFLHDRILATASVPASWRAGDNAILAILPSPPPDPAARVWHDSLRDGAIHRTARAWHAAPAEDRFLTLLTEGVALVAEIDIRA
ncbi:hypothetical protein AB0H43_13865 [Hamadaea sp. NPDC050747]|uniref:hypothetical protein n=1 Tax=Hamadaea sp. NPDC050747 TaxID=3155789 RepID=UPI00340B9432